MEAKLFQRVGACIFWSSSVRAANGEHMGEGMGEATSASFSCASRTLLRFVDSTSFFLSLLFSFGDLRQPPRGLRPLGVLPLLLLLPLPGSSAARLPLLPLPLLPHHPLRLHLHDRGGRHRTVMAQ